jgi:hypothetical protein
MKKTLKFIKRIFCFQIQDWQHIGWLTKNMIKQFFIGDMHEAKEAWYFILIHLSYDSKKIK